MKKEFSVADHSLSIVKLFLVTAAMALLFVLGYISCPSYGRYEAPGSSGRPSGATLEDVSILTRQDVIRYWSKEYAECIESSTCSRSYSRYVMEQLAIIYSTPYPACRSSSAE